MKSFHDVSIIILNIEESIYLERCIRSCIAQTFPGRSYEILVIDGNKQDFSKEIIQHYGDSISSFSVSKDKNLSDAMAKGIKEASGRFVLPLDSRDFISDYMIISQLIFLYDNSKSQAVAVDYWSIEKDSDRKIQRFSCQEAPIFFGVMYKKEVFLREGVYLVGKQDFHPERIIAHLRENGELGYLPISFYRCSTIENVRS